MANSLLNSVKSYRDEKILLVYFLIFILNSGSAQTNVYHPFPDSNAVWRESLSATDGTFGLYLWEEEKYIRGDTLLGNLVYHKIYKSGLAMHCTIPCFFPDTLNYYYNNFTGVLREDGSKRIYTYDPNQQRDTLLYDFDLQVGDTIPDSYNHFPASVNPITVTVIDSVFDGINYRKRFVLSGSNSSLVEGIGAMCGLFVPLDAYILEMGGTLHCFLQNDSVRYTDSSASACEIIDVAPAIFLGKISVTLSPNPFHTSARLEIHNLKTDVGDYRMKIYNTMGTLIRTDDVLHIPSYILHRDGLSTGLYLYELITNNYEVLTKGKFIIE